MLARGRVDVAGGQLRPDRRQELRGRQGHVTDPHFVDRAAEVLPAAVLQTADADCRVAAIEPGGGPDRGCCLCHQLAFDEQPLHPARVVQAGGDVQQLAARDRRRRPHHRHVVLRVGDLERQLPAGGDGEEPRVEAGAVIAAEDDLRQLRSGIGVAVDLHVGFQREAARQLEALMVRDAHTGVAAVEGQAQPAGRQRHGDAAGAADGLAVMLTAQVEDPVRGDFASNAFLEPPPGDHCRARRASCDRWPWTRRGARAHCGARRKEQAGGHGDRARRRGGELVCTEHEHALAPEKGAG